MPRKFRASVPRSGDIRPLSAEALKPLNEELASRANLFLTDKKNHAAAPLSTFLHQHNEKVRDCFITTINTAFPGGATTSNVSSRHFLSSGLIRAKDGITYQLKQQLGTEQDYTVVAQPLAGLFAEFADALQHAVTGEALVGSARRKR